MTVKELIKKLESYESQDIVCVDTNDSICLFDIDFIYDEDYQNDRYVILKIRSK